MSTQAVTREDIDEIIGIVRDFMQQVDERFNKAEQAAFELKQEVREVKQEIVDLKASHNRLLNTIDGFIARIDHYETEQAARDHQFEKLLAWARKVSAKTGIPLENL